MTSLSFETRFSAAVVALLVAPLAFASAVDGSPQAARSPGLLERGQNETCYYIESAGRRGRRGVPLVELCMGNQLSEIIPSRAELDDDFDAVIAGISNFEKRAHRVTTPAHTLAAATVMRLLTASRRRSKQVGPLGWGTRGERMTLANSTIDRLMDLRVKPGDESIKLQDFISAAEDMKLRMLVPEPGFDRPKKRKLWPYVQGRPVTRQRLLGAIDEQALRLKVTPVPIVFFYISSHGVTSSSGDPFLYVADSIENDAPTLVSYAEILHRYQSIAREHPDSAVLVIFDTCQTPAPIPTSAPAPEVLSDNLLVMTSAAVGQYSWFWTNETTKTLLKYRDAFRRQDDWYRQASEVEEINQGFSSTMSVLPVALARSLGDCEAVAAGSGATGELSVADWLIQGKSMAERLLREVSPETPQDITLSLPEAAQTSAGSPKRQRFRCPAGEGD